MESSLQFKDLSGFASEPIQLITPMVIPKEAIDAEIERLASLPAPANGRRVSQIVNPAAGTGPRFTPGPAATPCRLKPSEANKPLRHHPALSKFFKPRATSDPR